MSVLVSGHELLQTRDCAFGSCVDEAERGSEYCERHAGGVDRLRLRSLVETAREGTVTADEKKAAGLCKVEGCEHRRNTRYDRGVFSGLCEEVHIPAAREEVSRRSKDSRARGGGVRGRSVQPAPAPARAQRVERSRPEPEPFPPASEGFEARAARLVDVSRRLDEARAELVAAQAKVEEAETEYRSAHAELALE